MMNIVQSIDFTHLLIHALKNRLKSQKAQEVVNKDFDWTNLSSCKTKVKVSLRFYQNFHKVKNSAFSSQNLVHLIKCHSGKRKNFIPQNLRKVYEMGIFHSGLIWSNANCGWRHHMNHQYIYQCFKNTARNRRNLKSPNLQPPHFWVKKHGFHSGPWRWSEAVKLGRARLIIAGSFLLSQSASSLALSESLPSFRWQGWGPDQLFPLPIAQYPRTRSTQMRGSCKKSEEGLWLGEVATGLTNTQ